MGLSAAEVLERTAGAYASCRSYRDTGEETTTTYAPETDVDLPPEAFAFTPPA